ncbi:DUF1667 domain-containing protein [Lacrimispora sp.]|uniref:DUF1667 domain-containing protein n=1 Tax=Lacrimispora sp. TaxID=2719234 RepID=UPI0028B1B58F|nr:DUF1667 domain-containing protein [Lacrimispora sp.]
MEVRELICIRCPLGCPLTVSIEGDQVGVTGNSCGRGAEYGKKEVLSPTRVVTSSVRVLGGDLEMVPVKTKQDIPKDKIFVCMEEIRKMEVSAPVSIGDVIIPDCAGTGVSIVATRNVEKM